MTDRPSTAVEKHRDAIVELAVKHHATNVRVFGSVARGEDRPGSDLDLLVTFDEKATIYDQSSLILDLEELLGIKVDVVSDAALTDRHASIVKDARLI